MASSIDSDEKSLGKREDEKHHHRLRDSIVRTEQDLGNAADEPVYNQGTGLFKRASRGPTYKSEDLSARYSKPIDTFEGLHRWDPDFEWEPKEEQRVVRRINWRICLWVCVAFFGMHCCPVILLLQFR